MMLDEFIAGKLAILTMAELNEYFIKPGKTGKDSLDGEKILTGEQFWEIQKKCLERMKHLTK